MAAPGDVSKPGEVARDIVTTVLDACGLLLIAAGVGFQIAGWITTWAARPGGIGVVAVGGGLFVAGATLLVGSWLSDRLSNAGVHRGEP